MKCLTILFLVAMNLFGCNFGSLEYGSAAEKPISNRSILNNKCAEGSFKPKTDAQIAALDPRELIDEQVMSEVGRGVFTSYHDWAKYQSLVDKYIRKSGAKMLPALTNYINSYDPKNETDCDSTRFAVASKAADDLDRFVLRIRGSADGKSLITALDRAIERMKQIGFDDKQSDYENNRRYRIYELYLKDLKDLNEVDRSIKETFLVKRKVNISDEKLREFSDFLISRDPTYPSWSERELIKDFSRVNQAGNPSQVYVFKKPDRFYEAYEEFRKLNSGSRSN